MEIRISGADSNKLENDINNMSAAELKDALQRTRYFYPLFLYIEK